MRFWKQHPFNFCDSSTPHCFWWKWGLRKVWGAVKCENAIWEFGLCLKIINRSWHAAQPSWQDLNELSIISSVFLRRLEFSGLPVKPCFQKSSCDYSVLWEVAAASISRGWTWKELRKCYIKCLSKEREMLTVASRATFIVATAESLSLRLGPHIHDSPVPEKQLSIRKSYSTATIFFFPKNINMTELSHNWLEKASCGIGLGRRRLLSRM